MRNVVAILLISLHLAGNTELGQIFKLPNLIQHFFQHYRQDPSISFLKFIAMHYAGDDGTKEDDDFDNQLPCHNINHNTIVSVYTPMVKEILSFDFSYWETQNYKNHLSDGTSSKHVSLILQPPRA